MEQIECHPQKSFLLGMIRDLTQTGREKDSHKGVIGYIGWELKGLEV